MAMDAIDNSTEKKLSRMTHKIWGAHDMAPPVCPLCGASTELVGYLHNGPLFIECIGDCQREYEVDRLRPDEIAPS